MADTTGPLTETKVANMAGTTLDEEPITSLDDTGTFGVFCAANFGPCRDEVLALHPWVFAKTRTTLTAHVDEPAFDWTYQYELPADCIRMLPLRCEGRWNAPIVPHEREGRMILTDECAPLKVQYIKRITNISLWTPLAARVLAEYIALLAAQRLTGKISYVDKATRLYMKALNDASLANSLDYGTPEYVNEGDALTARLAG